MHLYVLPIALSVTLFSDGQLLGADRVVLVEQGKPKSELVIPADAPSEIREAVGHFQALVERSTGARIPVVREGMESGREGVYRLYVGDTAQARKAGLDSEKLEEEAYILCLGREQGILVGRDRIRSENPVRHESNSLPTRWGLNYLLERGIGVRWLWPGELGTYVPVKEDVTFEPLERRYQPVYLMRRQRIPPMAKTAHSEHRKTALPAMHSNGERRRMAREAITWLEDHQGGWRGPLLIQGQPFKHWWSRYAEKHPDYFAELPPPLKQPFRTPERVKLRLSNPAVIEQIAQEYIEAGAGPAWKLSPNDSGGFDISEGTRAWDIPKNQPIDAIIYGEANLTARYITFWNLVYERLSRINPDVILNSLVYASYRFAPPPERPLKAKMILSLTPSYEEFENWKAWADTGSMLILRPNWWAGGGGAPWIPLKEVEKFFRYANAHGMVAFDFDSIHGYWATQGIAYYLIARMGVDPELTREEIIEEYCSAFGAGAALIREYLGYWQDFSSRAGYPVHVGGHTPPVPGGAFDRAVRQHGINDGPWIGALQVLPYLYRDTAIAPAEALLDQALERTEKAGQREAAERVRFLKTGLDHLRILRDTMAAGAGKDRDDRSGSKRLREQAAKLLEFRRKVGAGHALWPEQAYLYEDRAKQPTIVENKGEQIPDWRAE